MGNVAKDGAPASQRTARRRVPRALSGALAALALTAAPAAAEDLILNAGQPDRTIVGPAVYDIVYIDGVLNLAGDTQILANQVYIGANAMLRTCFVAPNVANGCAAGRNLTHHVDARRS